MRSWLTGLSWKARLWLTRPLEIRLQERFDDQKEILMRLSEQLAEAQANNTAKADEILGKLDETLSDTRTIVDLIKNAEPGDPVTQEMVDAARAAGDRLDAMGVKVAAADAIADEVSPD
jgi:hypothetical protein